MILKALYNILNNDSSVVAAVGTDNTGNVKIYPGQAGRNTKEPYVVFEYQGMDPSPNKTKASPVDTWDVEFSIYAANRADLEDISLKIREKLDFLKVTDSGVEINRCMYDEANDTYDNDSQLHIRDDTYRVRARIT